MNDIVEFTYVYLHVWLRFLLPLTVHRTVSLVPVRPYPNKFSLRWALHFGCEVVSFALQTLWLISLLACVHVGRCLPQTMGELALLPWKAYSFTSQTCFKLRLSTGRRWDNVRVNHVQALYVCMWSVWVLSVATIYCGLEWRVSEHLLVYSKPLNKL